MKIAIDISQIAYHNTGVANFIFAWINALTTTDTQNDYILFFSSFRKEIRKDFIELVRTKKNVIIKKYNFPPTFLDILWNKLHILPIEWLVGNIDIFISSDWTQPPSHAKKMTIIYDMIVYKYPRETDKKIVDTQKRRLKWVRQECDVLFCISESTKNDVAAILNVPEKKLKILYPGI